MSVNKPNVKGAAQEVHETQAAPEQAQQVAQPTAIPEPQVQPQVQPQTQTQFTGNPQMTNQVPNNKREPLDIATIAMNFGPSFTLNSNDETTNKVAQFIQEALEHEAKALKGSLNVHIVSSNVTGTYSAVAISSSSIINGLPIAAVHTYMIESSYESQAYVSQTQFGPVEIPISVADAYNETFVKAIELEIAKHYKTEGLRMLDCGIQVVFKETKLETYKDFLRLLQEGANSLKNAQRESDKTSPKFTLGDIVASQKTRVMSRVSLTEKAVRANGLPVRSDIVCELKTVENLGQNNGPTQGVKELTLARASAYVDLIYTPPQQTFNNMWSQQAAQQPYYIPRITITSLDTDMAGCSLEFLLFGIANMVSLARNRAYGVVWKDQYAPRGGSVNPRNLGAVGLQVQGLTPDGQPAILDLSGNDAELRRLIETVIAPNPVFSLELEQAGPNSWLTNLFAAAAANPHGNEAHALYAAANRLTNGQFDVKLRTKLGASPDQDLRGYPLLSGTSDKSHLGYFTVEGEKRDLRELDLLGILNIVGSDPQVVSDYLGTLVVGHEPDMVRLDRRLRLIRRITNDVTVKGFTTKYNFEARFIEALAMAVEATGLVVNTSNLLNQDSQAAYHQSLQDWSNVMVNPSVVNNMFGNGQYNAPNQNFAYGNIGQPQMGGRFFY